MILHSENVSKRAAMVCRSVKGEADESETMVGSMRDGVGCACGLGQSRR